MISDRDNNTSSMKCLVKLRNHVRLDHILAYGARRIIYIARGCAVSRVLTFVRCFPFIFTKTTAFGLG